MKGICKFHAPLLLCNCFSVWSLTNATDSACSAHVDFFLGRHDTDMLWEACQLPLGWLWEVQLNARRHEGCGFLWLGSLWAPTTVSAEKAEEGSQDVKTSQVQRSPQALAEAQSFLALGILEAQTFAGEEGWFSFTDRDEQQRLVQICFNVFTERESGHW